MRFAEVVQSRSSLSLSLVLGDSVASGRVLNSTYRGTQTGQVTNLSTLWITPLDFSKQVAIMSIEH